MGHIIFAIVFTNFNQRIFDIHENQLYVFIIVPNNYRMMEKEKKNWFGQSNNYFIEQEEKKRKKRKEKLIKTNGLTHKSHNDDDFLNTFEGLSSFTVIIDRLFSFRFLFGLMIKLYNTAIS